MQHSYDQFPTLEYFESLTSKLPYENLKKEAILFELNAGSNLAQNYRFILNHDIDAWKDLFDERISHTYRSLIFLSFYKSLGIADDTWKKKNDKGVDFFHNFDESDWIHKDLFDCYVDSFLSKGFASLEILAHILVKRYQVIFDNDRKISFINVLNQLKTIDSKLFKKLNEIYISDHFKEGKQLRNDFTHNYPLSSLSSLAEFPVNKFKNYGDEKFKVTASIGASGAKYKTSAQTMNICYTFWGSLMDIITIINNHKSESDRL